MGQETVVATSSSHMKEMMSGEDPIFEVMDCQITLMMDRLLNLVSQFWQAMKTRMHSRDLVEILTSFTECSGGSNRGGPP